MSSNRKWQQTLLDDLSASLRKEPGVRALVLTGSLAEDSLEVDEWSDIDLTALVADDVIADLFSCASWLEGQGEIIGFERHEKLSTKTLRVCFAPCRRLDITLMPESILGTCVRGDDAAGCRAHVLIWSKIPQIDRLLPALFPSPTFDATPRQDIDTIVESFFFKAAVAIAKTARNDLIVALHLALDLARDCLVLQMLRRDRDKVTNVHRFGGFGNEIIARLFPGTGGASPLEILKLVERSAQVLDELASDLLSTYTLRAELLAPALRQVKSACSARTPNEQTDAQTGRGDAEDRAPHL